MAIHVRVRPEWNRTNVAIAEKVSQDFPNVPLHACVNPCGRTFASVMARTSLPHLLEHLIIDLQVQCAADDASTTFAGHTHWIPEEPGCALITVSFHDDRQALQAVRDACAYLNRLPNELFDEFDEKVNEVGALEGLRDVGNHASAVTPLAPLFEGVGGQSDDGHVLQISTT